MFKQQISRFAMVAALVTSIGFMAPAMALAAGPTGVGPNDAIAPSPNWQHLNIGQSRWYAFTSEGKDKNGDPSHVLITMYAQPGGSAGFNLWTPERLRERAAATDDPDKYVSPVGVGRAVDISKNDDQSRFAFNHALVWAGGFDVKSTLLVEVYQTGSQASDYLLSITGDEVTFPTSGTASQPAQAMAPAAQTALAGGSSPNNAAAPSPNWQHLNIGQSRWYAFTSDGKDKNGDPSHVLITMYAQPGGSAGFNIWTAERLRERAASDDPNKDAPPVGVGAPVQMTNSNGDVTETLFNHALVWAGGFDSRQTYLIEVYQTGSQPSDYLLSITGDAVSFP